MTLEPKTDRRSRPRFQLACPLLVLRPGIEPVVAARTADVSCQGFYFTSEHSFVPSEKVECELVIQGATNGTTGSTSGGIFPEMAVLLRGKAEVVRVDLTDAESTFGVACRLESYTVHQPKPEEVTQQEALAAI
jgi:hypothetical protein